MQVFPRARLFFVSMVVAVSASASPSPMKVKPGSIAKAARTGFFAGGEATHELSLIDATTSKAADGSESLAFFYGNDRGQPLRGLPGFFQIVLDRDGKRVAIDLAQVSRTAVDPAALRKKLKSSKLVSALDMTMDPTDSSTNITLSFKEPIELAVEASGEKSPSRIAITLKPLGGSKK